MEDNNQFIGVINIGDETNSYNLNFGYIEGNSFNYNKNTDKFAPPPPPQTFFDAALNIKGERYYSKILSPENNIYTILLQYGSNNKIVLKWDNTGWDKLLDMCYIEDIASGQLGVNVDMLKCNTLTITNNDITKIKLIVKKS